VSTILEAVNAVRRCDRILVEAGPQLMGDFLAEHYLNELFLTLAPQIAGRDSSVERPGFVVGKLFAPEHPLWGTLISVRRAGSHLFLRYAFKTHKQA
jgi:riboflavin biosynthesis pyrimidine reductase